MRRDGNQHYRWRVRQFNLLLLYCCLLAAPRPGGSVLFVVYNQTAGQVPTRFDDVPALDGFGPRVPEEVSQSISYKYLLYHVFFSMFICLEKLYFVVFLKELWGLQSPFFGII